MSDRPREARGFLASGRPTAEACWSGFGEAEFAADDGAVAASLFGEVEGVVGALEEGTRRIIHPVVTPHSTGELLQSAAATIPRRTTRHTNARIRC